MRFLILTPGLPYPPHQGGALRNYGIIQGLAHSGHEIHLLSFCDPGAPEVASTPLTQFCTRIETVPPPQRKTTLRLLDLLTTSQPDLALRFRSEGFRSCLEALLREKPFDIIQFEGLEMAIYLPLARRLQPSARLCYDAHNAEYALQRAIFQVDRSDYRRWPSALYSLIQSQRIYHLERAVCQQADCVIAVSQEDAEALSDFRDDGRIFVVPNGIFVEEYSVRREKLDLGEHVLVFTGKMDYRPNVDAMLWFASDVLPQVEIYFPDVRLYIVGQKPHPRLEPLRSPRNVAITGWVHEVQPYLNAAHVYVAPLRIGSGTRLKILEAMAAGCAVVATPIAVSGLPAEAKSALVIAEDTNELANAIVALLQDPKRREQLGKEAQASVRKLYDWKVLIPHLLEAYEQLNSG